MINTEEYITKTKRIVEDLKTIKEIKQKHGDALFLVCSPLTSEEDYQFLLSLLKKHSSLILIAIAGREYRLEDLTEAGLGERFFETKSNIPHSCTSSDIIISFTKDQPFSIALENNAKMNKCMFLYEMDSKEAGMTNEEFFNSLSETYKGSKDGFSLFTEFFGTCLDKETADKFFYSPLTGGEKYAEWIRYAFSYREFLFKSYDLSSFIFSEMTKARTAEHFKRAVIS